MADLTLDNLGDWPVAAKGFLLAALAAVIIGGGYFLLIQDKQDDLKRAQRRESSLKQEFESKQRRVANLDAYRKQMTVMREMFKRLLAFLPKGTEVPDLIDDISRLALENGLTVLELDLQDEVQMGFYVELPIKVKVRGAYHQIGSFLSAVAKLPRIVTFHDFQMKHYELGSRGQRKLVHTPVQELNVTAKTYRYQG